MKTKKLVGFFVALVLVTVLSGCSTSGRKEEITSADKIAGETEVPTDAREGIEAKDSYPGDWKYVQFEDGRRYIDVSYFEQYKDSGVTVEVMFYLVKKDYFLLGISNAARKGELLYSLNKDYISGMATEDKAYDANKMPLYYVYMQNDGFTAFSAIGCWNAGYDFDCYSFTFDLSADAIKYLLSGEGESKGIAFQTYGVQLKKVIINTGRVDSTVKKNS